MNALHDLFCALPHPPDYEWDWPALADSPLGPLLHRLDAIPQSPIWHGEGDAGRHTRLVCEALTTDAAYRILPESTQRALALAALLHDAGKIPTTRLEDGAWVSPSHSAVGAQMARERLWMDLGLSGDPAAQQLREAVCLYVRHHMLPGHILDQEDPSLRLLKMAANGELCPDFTPDALCLLAEADVRGRIAPDCAELLDMVALCRQEAAEAGCLHGPGAFADAHTQRAFFKGRNVWRGQRLYDDTWGEVILLSGLPGTGKDTWIAAQHPSLPVVSLDALRLSLGIAPTDNQGRVIQAAKEQARIHLRAKRPFIWNATNLTAVTREGLISLFEEYGAAVRIVYLEAAWQENLRRNADRDAAVPEHEIIHMLGKLTPPLRHEARHVDWLCTT